VKNNIKARIYFNVLLLILVMFLLYMAIVPFGEISYIQDFDSNNFFIQKLGPNDRIQKQDGLVRIIGDPVYFSLRTPRRFNQVNLSYKFRTNIDEAIIETGPLVDKTIWRHQLKPINNSIINTLIDSGNASKNNNLLFWQKEKKYSSINEFLSVPPPNNEIALYYYSWPNEFVLIDYASSTEDLVIDYPLRGAYQFYTYVNTETLDFEFIFSDLNQNQDNDKIELILSYDGEILDLRSLDDEGKENNKVEERGEIDLKIPNLPSGLYKIELKVSNDIVTKKITSKQNKLSFINKIELLRDNGVYIKMYTDSRSIQATTMYPDRLQSIQVGSSSLELAETYRQYQIFAQDNISEVVLEKDGIILSGNGVWAFNEKSLFNPNFKKVDKDLDIINTDYILASYEVPVKEGDWQRGEQTFDLRQAYRENGAYQFVISIPGLRADDEFEDWVEIGEIKVDLKGKGLWEKIFRN
jgi:hypothetical protein